MKDGRKSESEASNNLKIKVCKELSDGLRGMQKYAP